MRAERSSNSIGLISPPPSFASTTSRLPRNPLITSVTTNHSHLTLTLSSRSTPYSLQQRRFVPPPEPFLRFPIMRTAGPKGHQRDNTAANLQQRADGIKSTYYACCEAERDSTPPRPKDDDGEIVGAKASQAKLDQKTRGVKRYAPY